VAELLLGVDGGGSKTLALVADPRGRVLGRGIGGSSNYQSVGFAAATGALEAAITDALRSAGSDPACPIAAACFGLAGVGRPADRATFNAWLKEHGRIRRWTLVNDAELVLAAGTPAGWGVALICGTGSFCYGRAPDGRTSRAGGWGHLIGDEGSGYALGVQALRLATQTADGRADAQAMLHTLLHHWQLSDPAELVHYVYDPARTRADIAALAEPITALAEQGDRFARELVDQAAYELGRMVAAVVRRLGLETPPLATGGGRFGAGSNLGQAIAAQAGVVLGPIRHVHEPAGGALVLARRLLDAESAG